VNNDTVGNGYTAVELVFIQFAGFTFGKSASAFSTPWHGYPGNNTAFLVGGYDTVTGINSTLSSGPIAPGNTFSYTFTAPGTYIYRCIYHPWMTGAIKVLPSSSG